jgi:predicted amidohydrolase YtcJ
MTAASSFLVRGRVSDIGAPGRQASAVLIQNGRVAAVGGDEVVSGASQSETRIVDLGDRLIAPGFVDAHAHIEVAAVALASTVDCRFPTCRKIDDVLQTLRDNLDRAADGWLVAQANLFWNLKLAEGRFPTRQELDSVSREVAIVIRAGGHASILNSKAFELSDVTRFEGQPAMMGQAVIERDSAGELTGLIAELDNALPLPQLTRAELRAALESGGRELFTRHGVTTVGEITETLDGIQCMDELACTERFPLRVSYYIWAPGTMSFDEACVWSQHLKLSASPEQLRVRGVKLFADGGYSSANAALRTPYQPPFASEPGWCGELNLTDEQLTDAVRRTRERGLQLAVHANGERTQLHVCRAARAVPELDGAPPVRVEHAGNVVTQSDSPSIWRSAGAVIVPTPAFLYIGFGDFLPQYMGEVGEHGRFPFRRLIDDGWSLPSSSDVHLGADPRQTNPLFSMWCCVKRETFLGAIVEPDEAISIQEAHWMHTLGAAQALGREDDLGSIEVGKCADLAVLSRDPAETPVDDLPQLPVDYVFTAGRLAYRNPAAPDLKV